MDTNIEDIDDEIYRKFSKASVLAWFEHAPNISDQAKEMVAFINKEVDMEDSEDPDDLL